MLEGMTEGFVVLSRGKEGGSRHACQRRGMEEGRGRRAVHVRAGGVAGTLRGGLAAARNSARHANWPLLAPSARPPLRLITFLFLIPTPTNQYCCCCFCLLRSAALTPVMWGIMVYQKSTANSVLLARVPGSRWCLSFVTRKCS